MNASAFRDLWAKVMYLQGAAVPKRAWGPPFLFQTLRSYKIKSLTKISVQVLFQRNDLKAFLLSCASLRPRLRKRKTTTTTNV